MHTHTTAALRLCLRAGMIHKHTLWPLFLNVQFLLLYCSNLASWGFFLLKLLVYFACFHITNQWFKYAQSKCKYCMSQLTPLERALSLNTEAPHEYHESEVQIKTTSTLPWKELASQKFHYRCHQLSLVLTQFKQYQFKVLSLGHAHIPIALTRTRFHTLFCVPAQFRHTLPGYLSYSVTLVGLS